MEKLLRKKIRKEISKLFENIDFDNPASTQFATSIATHKIPRKGIDDSINRHDELLFQVKNNSIQNGCGEEDQIQQNNEGYSIFGDTTSLQNNLDHSFNEPKYGGNSKEFTKEINDFNDNINKELSVKSVKTN